MMSSKVYFLFACGAGAVSAGVVRRATGGGKSERGGGGDASSRVLGGVGTRTGSVAVPFLNAIR